MDQFLDGKTKFALYMVAVVLIGESLVKYSVISKKHTEKLLLAEILIIFAGMPFFK